MMNNTQTLEAPKVNLIAKDILAKLMATENLTVQHVTGISTASFNLENRTLSLPIFRNVSENVYDLLISHECSHAINTPVEDWKKAIDDHSSVPGYQMLMNVLEDARIEKLIQKKFPGLGKAFVFGYNELYENDFFGTKTSGKPISDYAFLDRLNLFFKLGHLGKIRIPFVDATEQQIVKEVEKLETFADVVALAEKIINLIPEKKEPKQEQKQSEGSASNPKESDGIEEEKESGSESSDKEDGKKAGEAESESSDGEEGEDSSSDSESSDSEWSDKEEGKDGAPSSSVDSKSSEEEKQSNESNKFFNPTPSTGETLKKEEENKKSLVEKYSHAKTIGYYNIPDNNSFNYKKAVVDYKIVHNDIELHYNVEAPLIHCNEICCGQLAAAASAFLRFKNDNNSVISYLVKEFELKKAADAHVRNSVSKTGIIDTNKLHSHGFNDDIFLKRSVVKDGKNHGLIMFVDGSESMHTCIAETLEQLLILVLFCKRINIPFEVYSFHELPSSAHRNYITAVDQNPKQKDLILENFQLRNYFSSRMNAHDFLRACNNIYAMITAYKYGAGGSYRRGNHTLPTTEKLCSTPLCESIITAVPLINDFRAKNRLQVVNMVLLSDGCANSLKYADKYPNEQLMRHFPMYSNNSSVFTSPRTKKQYSFAGQPARNEFTNSASLLQYLKDETGVNILGFFLVPPVVRQIKYAISSICGVRLHSDKLKELKKEFVNNNSLLCKNVVGYDELYIMSSSLFRIKDDTLRLNGSTNRAKAKEITKTFKGRIQSRVILDKFIEKIG